MLCIMAMGTIQNVPKKGSKTLQNDRTQLYEQFLSYGQNESCEKLVFHCRS